MSRRPAFADIEPSADQMESALADLIERSDDFLEWVSCEALADDIREPSTYFPEAGGISCVEMFRQAASGAFTDEQCKWVFLELVDRFANARHEQIEALAKKKAISDWPDDERARLEAV